jgi:hypothetical protein
MDQWQQSHATGGANYRQVQQQHPEWMSGGWIDPKKGITGNQADFLQSMFLGYDVPRMQGAADEQYARVNQGISEMQAGTQRGYDDITNATRTSANDLRSFSNEVGAPAMGYAAQSVANAQENVRQANEQAGAGIQGAVAGLYSSTRNNMALSLSGTNPDGSPMTAEQKAAVSKQMIYDTGTQAAQIRSQYNAQVLSMRANLSAADQGAAGTATQVGQIASGLRTTAANLETSGAIAGAQLLAQGNKDAAALMLANPRSIVSISNGILNMWGVFMGSTPAKQPGQALQAAPAVGAVAGGVIGSIFAPGAGTAVGASAGAGLGSEFANMYQANHS